MRYWVILILLAFLIGCFEDNAVAPEETTKIAIESIYIHDTIVEYDTIFINDTIYIEPPDSAELAIGWTPAIRSVSHNGYIGDTEAISIGFNVDAATNPLEVVAYMSRAKDGPYQKIYTDEFRRCTYNIITGAANCNPHIFIYIKSSTVLASFKPYNGKTFWFKVSFRDQQGVEWPQSEPYSKYFMENLY